jgi:hypothetical protein
MDARLSFVYKWLVRAVSGALSVALFLHLRQTYQMRNYANQVVQRIEKEGGQVVVDDNIMTIMMDGKVQEVIDMTQAKDVNSLT